MVFSMFNIVLVLIILVITILIILLITYINKRDKGSFHLHIKLGPFELIIDTTAEKIIKRVKKD